MGFWISGGDIVYLYLVLFWIAISYDHLSSLFDPDICFNKSGSQINAKHRHTWSWEESIGKTNETSRLAIRFLKYGAVLKVLRTIESFLPYICGPVNQAFQISNRLEKNGICSPIYTTYSDVPSYLPKKQIFDNVTVNRFPSQFKIMRYLVSIGMLKHLKRFDILHSHNYRNFQTDSGFFLHWLGISLSF